MRLLLVLLAVLAWVSVGCGYRWEGAQGVYPEGIDTVNIPVVANRTFERDDGGALTDALVRQIEARTPYRVAPAESADTMLLVTITHAGRTELSRDRVTGLPQEQLYIVVANLEWRDLRSGRVLMRRENFEQTMTYYPGLGEGRFLSSQVAAERLAAGIVEQLTGAW